MSQAESWASAYRTEAANTADAHLGIFHTRLSKHIYHEALKRKQLDILVKVGSTMLLSAVWTYGIEIETASFFPHFRYCCDSGEVSCHSSITL